MNKGFKQFLNKLGIFLVVFVLIQFIIAWSPYESIVQSKLKLFVLVDLVMAVLVISILFFMIYREKFFNIKMYEIKSKASILFGLVSFLFLSFYLWFGSFVSNNSLIIDSNLLLFGILRYFILFLVLVFLFISVFGSKFTKNFALGFKKQVILFVILVFFMRFLIDGFQSLWPLFCSVVAKSVHFLLSLTFDATLNLSGNLPIVGIDKFRIGIAESCSGIASMFLFGFLYLFATSLDWKVLNKKKVILMFIPGVLSVFVLNIFRIYLLILVGAFISSDFAIGIFHAGIAGVIFIIYFAVFWNLSYKWMKKKG